MAKAMFKWHDSIWVEKYRPKKLEDLILNKDYREKFEFFLKIKEIKNIILEGSQGVGKSTLTDIFITQIPCEIKLVNASDNRGLELIREQIVPFVTTSSFEPLKIVILEEGDKLTPDAQDSLKVLTEQYTEDVRFIITCNNVDLLNAPLRSRFQEFHIQTPSEEQVKKRCKFILEKENVTYEELELDTIIRYNFPDIRKTIQYLDQHSINGVLKLDREFFNILNYEKQIIETLKKSNKTNYIDLVTDIRQLIANTKIRSFVTLYKYLYKNIDEYLPKNKIIGGIITLHLGIKEDTQIPDKEINLITTLIKLLELKNG